MKTIITLLIILTHIYPVFAKTYEIVEPDAIEEIRKKPKIDIQKYKKQLFADLNSNKGVILPPAPDNHTRFIDPTYTLTKEIAEYSKDGKKKRVLYPAGFKFNPIDYSIVFPPHIFVFNACNEPERNFAENYAKTEPTTLFVSTNCPLEKIRNISDKPVYLLTKNITEHFGLRYSVSIIKVNKEKRRIEVNEIKIR
ncbi:MAG: hypothetical protein LBH05_06590 [Deferribacteraceae bacterium]|jgi:hypothetical protein|nr:hypothetical protein [Deferribacteraceae bacterium]